MQKDRGDMVQSSQCHEGYRIKSVQVPHSALYSSYV